MEASSVCPIALGASCHRSWRAWSYFTIPWTFVLRLCSTNLFALILLGPLFAAAPKDSDEAAKKPQQHVKRRFGKDLLANFGGLFAPSNIGPWIAGAAATGLATIPEQDIKEHFAPGDRWGRWSSPGKHMGNDSILAAAAGGLFWAGRKSDNSRFRDATYSLMQATIVNVAVTRAVKVTTGRQRPNGDEFSFPSGHASTTFMWATVFAEHYGTKAAIPGYLAAAYVAATRLEERKHHLTDVVAGAAIGYIAGRTVSRRTRRNPESRITWQVTPMGRGFAASISLRL